MQEAVAYGRITVGEVEEMLAKEATVSFIGPPSQTNLLLAELALPFLIKDCSSVRMIFNQIPKLILEQEEEAEEFLEITAELTKSSREDFQEGVSFTFTHSAVFSLYMATPI